MNNKNNPHIIAGLIFILFSLGFLAGRTDKSIDAYLGHKKDGFDLAIETSAGQEQFNRLRKDVVDMNREVNVLSANMAVLLKEANDINDNIVAFMNNAPADQETLDSLKRMEDAIAIRESRIDSLNVKFSSSSDSLLLLMSEYNRLEEELTMASNTIADLKNRILIKATLSIIYLFFSLAGLVSGLILMIIGFRSYQKAE